MNSLEIISAKNPYGFDTIAPSAISPSIKRCYSPNMHQFFTVKWNRTYCQVIRHDGALWFAMIYKGVQQQDYWKKPYDEWTGVRVVEVACQGKKATTGWMTSQNRSGFEDVTEWFWSKYLAEGMYGVYEVWHRSYPKQLTHREHSTI